MKMLTQEIIKKLPPRYSQENEKDPLAVCKFFDPTGSWTWYVIEGWQEDGEWCFFGLVDGFERELGYFTLRDLETAKEGVRGLRSVPIERDRWFTPCRVSELKVTS